MIIDPGYKSDYKLSLEISAGAGADLTGALALLGLMNVSAVELVLSTDLARSPVGAVTAEIARAPTSTGTDPSKFQTGDTVTVTVKLDPASSSFLGLYNVNELFLVRRTGGAQTSVASGVSHTCSSISNGTMQCWGGNVVGQLGDGTTDNSATPVAVNGITTAMPNSSATCVPLTTGTLKCWGRGAEGQLGNGDTVNSTTPVTALGISTATAVASSAKHACAVLANQTLRCWGDNSFAQLGDGTASNSSSPVVVVGFP